MTLETSKAEMLECLGAKPSISEEHGLSLIGKQDLLIFSPGISTAGFAEIRMARANPDRKIIATTIDEKGLNFAKEVIQELGYQNQIEAKLEDLREPDAYPDEYFDFIYARLVLHYLSAQELDSVLANFHRTLKPDGKLFIVLRSVKNITESEDITFDEQTKFTTIPHYNAQGEIANKEIRYFHTPQTIQQHLEKAHFTMKQVDEYQEQLYKDFMRKVPSPNVDHVIEVQSSK